MKWIEARVTLVNGDVQPAVELVAEAFDLLKAGGVVIEDPDEEPEEGWGDGPIFRPEAHAVVGFFPADPRAEDRCRRLETEATRLEKALGCILRVDYRTLDEEDWAESWKAFFWPEKLSPTLVVKPTWRPYAAKEGETVLEIDPGMAFGTGTHPTTRLCIHMIEAHLVKGDRVLDVGTGSGILSIAAARLGAGRVVGIDTDPVAIGVAEKNMQINHIPESRFVMRPGSLDAVTEGPFDVVVANILSEVIVELLDGIPRVLKVGGIFICSGIIKKNRGMVAEKLARVGFDLFDTRSLENWVAMAARRNPT